MVNSEEFSKRLQRIMDYYNETASSFAEKIGAQRSSISHILSGRNRPSLEFILKIMDNYPDVELYWLLKGKGVFPSSSSSSSEKKALKVPSSNKEEIRVKKNKEEDKLIERIVIFYTDGSFSSFKN